MGCVQRFPSGGEPRKLRESDEDTPRDHSSTIFHSRRTSNRACLRLRCAERQCEGIEKIPVRIVIFDFDETLTLATFMKKGMKQGGKHQKKLIEALLSVNFESPWAPGKRIDKLRKMLVDLQGVKNGVPTRSLAILTRNEGGLAAALQLLQFAKLASYFDCIWKMPWHPGKANGVWNDGERWHYFNPPMEEVFDHKADVIVDIGNRPKSWFPQIGNSDKPSVVGLEKLVSEGIVLVDDQRANFQSQTGAKVARYCKVARYSAYYHNFGLIENMGGVGAHSDDDYETLTKFVEDPWMCKETFQVKCFEREFPEAHKRTPVSLVVFDFDETITLATFMPQEQGFSEQIGWVPSEDSSEWTEDDLILYNFESPWVDDSRVGRLRSLFKCLTEMAEPRTLAILTRNPSGAIAVLNLLMMAKLSNFFAVIWTLPNGEGKASGVYFDGQNWRSFDPPVGQAEDHKADILHQIAKRPKDWLPQLESKTFWHAKLANLKPEGIVLVDDERANWTNTSSEVSVLRCCKVARYDEAYRDCGLLNQMGGIGAHCADDYEELRSFIEQPWEYPFDRLGATLTIQRPTVLPVSVALIGRKNTETATYPKDAQDGLPVKTDSGISSHSQTSLDDDRHVGELPVKLDSGVSVLSRQSDQDPPEWMLPRSESFETNATDTAELGGVLEVKRLPVHQERYKRARMKSGGFSSEKTASVSI
eukprot:TRINITY_DN22915_c1_g1_i1.p1 TRINITY_DN22915_c1_g1~~TRINITY_DN22915_c1_g1_i1.p1  ORF type:complete len:703 (+),score=87.54 TRINITY_DN22915_c1_g1_i1:66-2174(+)